MVRIELGYLMHVNVNSTGFELEPWQALRYGQNLELVSEEEYPWQGQCYRGDVAPFCLHGLDFNSESSAFCRMGLRSWYEAGQILGFSAERGAMGYRLCACIICIHMYTYVTTFSSQPPHLTCETMSPVRPQMVPSTWCNWIPRPWHWYHGCSVQLISAGSQLIQLVETLPRKRRRQSPVWVMKCKEWTSWSLWRRGCTRVSILFCFLLELVSGIRKRDHQDGELLDLLKTAMSAMCMIVHEKCPKIYSMPHACIIFNIF